MLVTRCSSAMKRTEAGDIGAGDGPRFEASSENELVSLDDEGHVLLVRKLGLLAQPEAVVNGEGVDRDGQMLRVDLGELFAAGIVSRKKHPIHKKSFFCAHQCLDANSASF